MEGLETIRSFREDFYSLVSQIPEGSITTYGALADALGDDIAARAVGTMLNQNPNPIEVPCHRVVRSSGKIGGYASGQDKKKELLIREGLDIKNEKITDFRENLFEDFRSDRPLEKLRLIQKNIRDEVVIDHSNGDFRVIAGVDVSYSHPKAYASLSLWDRTELKDVFISETKMSFPYIPTYLAFRELPCMLEVLEKSKPRPDVILVDGNGMMHPERIGLASHLGVETNIPTIGVAKSQLCGKVVEDVNQTNRSSEIIEDGELLGYAVLQGNRAKNPIYVSPGHLIGYEKAIEIVRDHCTHKVPEPIRKAHIEAKKRRKKDG